MRYGYGESQHAARIASGTARYLADKDREIQRLKKKLKRKNKK